VQIPGKPPFLAAALPTFETSQILHNTVRYPHTINVWVADSAVVKKFWLATDIVQIVWISIIIDKLQQILLYITGVMVQFIIYLRKRKFSFGLRLPIYRPGSNLVAM